MKKFFKTAAIVASLSAFSYFLSPVQLPNKIFYKKNPEVYKLQDSTSENILVAYRELKNIRMSYGLDTNFVLESSFCAVAQKFATQLADSSHPISHNMPFNKFSERALSLSAFRCNLGEAIIFCSNIVPTTKAIKYMIEELLNSTYHREIILKTTVDYVGIGVGYNSKDKKLVIVIITGYK
ncbi:MAG: CAP domain-containing protein [Candidatus Anstonellaceae archaeon]